DRIRRNGKVRKQSRGEGRSVARCVGGGTTLPCSRQRNRRPYRRRHRGSATKASASARRHRGTFDGRNECRRGFIRLGSDVLAAGGEERAGNEEGGGLSPAVHGSGKISGCKTAGPSGYGDCERRRPRHRKEHRWRCPAV